MGSITFDPTSVPLSVLPATPLAVRYSPVAGYLSLPNIVCVSVHRASGPDPGSARFRYLLDELNPPGFPARIEDVLGLDRSGPYVVTQDDRLAVLIPSAFGPRVIFDGFAQVPQGDLSPQSEDATFEAVGVAARCWDTPIAGAVYRNGPDVTVVSDVQTDRPARFNPDGRPNRVPSGSFAGPDATRLYPTFVDPATSEAADATHAFWTVSDAASYIIAQGNDDAYVVGPSLASLASLLCNKTQGSGLLDPAVQPATPIRCQDLDVTGEPWPVALAKLIHPHNFDFAFVTSQASTGKPLTYLYFFRTDDADNRDVKAVYLQRPGNALNPALSNMDAMGVARDGSKIANDIVIDTQQTRHEIGIVLAPGFTPSATDATPANFPTFDTDHLNFIPANQDKYRVYVANEDGSGFWDFPSASLKTSPVCDFTPVFGKPIPAALGGPPTPRYANHRRPGISTLFSLDGTKERRRAKLFISRDYNTQVPGIWDRSGSWSEVLSDWELLPDRLGVRITTSKISALKFGTPVTGFGTLEVNAGGHLSLVESQNNAFSIVTTNMSPRVLFMLVCVVESDAGLSAQAPPRQSSIARFGITRRVDARDRFVKHVISQSSIFNANAQDTTDGTVGGRDDTNDAISYAEAMRASTENATFAGTIAIPWISGAYEVGDKIGGVIGRGINLRTNGGFGGGEAAQYAILTGLTWTFEPRQSTGLHTSDLRKEALPPPEHQR